MFSRSVNNTSSVIRMMIIVDATTWSLILESRVVKMTTLEPSFTIVIVYNTGH